jgi:hypothetical protein
MNGATKPNEIAFRSERSRVATSEVLGGYDCVQVEAFLQNGQLLSTLFAFRAQVVF